jgi:hypothetical protein
MAPEELASVEEAIYDQSFRTLDEQARVLEGLRARAGTLVGVATVTTAFVGGLTHMSSGSKGPGLDVVSWARAGDVAVALPTDDRVLQRQELRHESAATDAVVVDARDMKWPITIRKRPKPQWPEPPPPSTPDTSVSERGDPKR